MTVALALFAACRNNFYHELIPPDGDRITSFVVYGQTQPTAIGENRIELSVGKDVNIQTIYPSIAVSQGARVFPVTFEYILATFPGIDIITEMKNFYTTDDLYEYTRNLIRNTPGFNVPVLDKPIDFSGPVKFFVVAGLGNTREYTVNVTQDTGEPTLLGFRFTKYDNAEILTDAVPAIEGDTLNVTAMYPVEIPLSYRLIPSFQILGEKLEIDGVEIISGVTEVQFSQSLNVPQTKTITVTRDGVSKNWILNLTFREDPDTIRSITDFRFKKTDNSFIVSNAVASIVNDGDFGTIKVQVLYEGAKPSILVPSFLSPSLVRVGEPGVLQRSGETPQDFSAPIKYRVTSRNGQYTRVYTVQTEFIPLASAIPRILTFGLSPVHNPGIIRASRGEVADGHIIIDVHYGGYVAPDILIPEFTAEGLVTVLGSVQTSGVSSQDFSRRQIYRVTHPNNASLFRDYSVQTRLIRDTSSDALITSFGFHPQAGLSDALAGRIQQDTISVHAPEHSGVNELVLSPYFTATGHVSVRGVAQESGVSSHIFSGPVEYTVVSPNGLKTRTYTVNVREMPAMRVYVNGRVAGGWNDGTSWQNAFHSIRDAAAATLSYPAEVPKEMWIAAGTYTVGSWEQLPVVANIVYSGGFSGWEASKDQRNTAANRTIISGGRSTGTLFTSEITIPPLGRSAAWAITGDVAFEHLEFTEAGTAINVTMAAGADVRMTDLRFSEMSGDAARLSGANDITVSNLAFSKVDGSGVTLSAVNDIAVSNLAFSSIGGSGVTLSGDDGRRNIRKVAAADGVNGAVISVSGGSSLAVSEVDIQGGAGSGIVARGSTGDVTITSATMAGIVGKAVDISGGGGRRDITGLNVDGGVAVGGGSSLAVHKVHIQGSGSGGIFANDIAGLVSISESSAKDITGDGIAITGGSGTRYLSGITGNTIRGRGINVDAPESSTVTLHKVEMKDIFLPKPDLIYGDWLPTYTQPIAVSIHGGTITLDEFSLENVPSSGTYSYTLGNITYTRSFLHNGIRIDGTTVTVSGSKASEISGHGVRVQGANIRVDGNSSITNSGTDGFYLSAYTGESSNINVENVTVNGARGGLYANGGTNGQVTLFEVDVKNSQSFGIRVLTGAAGGVFISNSTVEDSSTGIDAEAYTNSGSSVISDNILGTVRILNSTIKNNRSALLMGQANFTITGVQFINNSVSNFDTRGSFGIFQNCTFIHDDRMERGDAPIGSEYRALFHIRVATVEFNNCDFINLLGFPAYETFYFCRWSSNNVIYESHNIVLRNSRFTFKQGERVGLIAGYAGTTTSGPYPDYLLMDNVTITNNGSTIPLFWFYGANPGNTFRFKKNNRYKAPGSADFITINDQSALARLGSVVRLEQGARITLVD
ncbi:MAG: right-handed parallel beta-helix repeat-containing protein [Treponema sp.]|nr:right-handed parallel beta-helix repeat-containing protein [Treponema sp.]